MARISVVTQAAPLAGLAPNHTAPNADGDIVDVSAGTFLSVINGGAAPINVTVVTPEVVDGDLTIADRVVAVPVSTTPKLIPLTSVHYRQPVGDANAGRALVDYSAIVSVTRAVIKI
ncbi:hypothetical protein ACFORH_42985 [Amycolatopsis roodepoortensis]|uniref:Uncharacterized protein n=1 Tax=Amycolatopsis roodepoortensis TaxID=700274 RepID=A0ABR9L3D2_9PSEU|nr:MULTISPECIES: hypothetical protein [Amycolatopsis]MBE1575062.1 hypothetical protein [Amycolatopsis roodepoortensis]GHG97579.1 hypothetical protein GCM10017788_77200 [Amycolatopsis acidiphila]